MQGLINAIMASAFLILAAAGRLEAQPGRVTGSGASERFLSPKYDFSVPVPAGWFAATNGSTPFFFNFPPRGTPGRGYLPTSGATINIVAQSELPSRQGRETLSDWADRDADAGVADSKNARAVEMPVETEITRAFLTSFDLKTYGPDDQPQHQVNVYWEFRGRLFAAHLLYVRRNPHAAELDETLLSIMRGVRPLGSG